MRSSGSLLTLTIRYLLNVQLLLNINKQQRVQANFIISDLFLFKKSYKICYRQYFYQLYQMKQESYQFQPQPNKKIFHQNNKNLTHNLDSKKTCNNINRPQQTCHMNTFDSQSIEHFSHKFTDSKERYEYEAANNLRQISQNHWQLQNQTDKKKFSIRNNQNIDEKNYNTISFKPRKQPKNYLAFNKTCTLKQKSSNMYRNDFFQLNQKQQDKSSRYKQREAQTSMYFYESLNLKNISDNIQEDQMLLNDFNKQQSKVQSYHGFVNMKQTLRSKSEYYQRLKYHLFKTFQIDGKQLLKQNTIIKKKNDQKYTIDGNQFLTQSPATHSYFNKDSINSSQRRQVYSSKKKISLDLSTLDVPYSSLAHTNQNISTSIHSQLNRSKQLKLMQQQEYNYLQSKKDKKKIINYNNKKKNQNVKEGQTPTNFNQMDVNLDINQEIPFQYYKKKDQDKKKVRNNKSNRIDLSLMSKWDRSNMRGKLWLGRPPVKIIQKMSQSREIE